MKPYKGPKPNGKDQKTGLTVPHLTPHEQEIKVLNDKHRAEIEAKDKEILNLEKYQETLLVKVGEAAGRYGLLNDKYTKLEGSVSFVEKQSVKDRGDVVRIQRDFDAVNALLKSRTEELQVARLNKSKLWEDLQQVREELAAHKKTALEALEDRQDGVDVSSLSKEDIERLRKQLSKRVKDLNGN